MLQFHHKLRLERQERRPRGTPALATPDDGVAFAHIAAGVTTRIAATMESAGKWKVRESGKCASCSFIQNRTKWKVRESGKCGKVESAGKWKVRQLQLYSESHNRAQQEGRSGCDDSVVYVPAAPYKHRSASERM